MQKGASSIKRGGSRLVCIFGYRRLHYKDKLYCLTGYNSVAKGQVSLVNVKHLRLTRIIYFCQRY